MGGNGMVQLWDVQIQVQLYNVIQYFTYDYRLLQCYSYNMLQYVTILYGYRIYSWINGKVGYISTSYLYGIWGP